MSDLSSDVMASPNKLTECRRDVELIHCSETGRADLHKISAKLSPKAEHALCTNTVIFPLILGLYLCCNAKENRKKCEPVNTFRVPDSCVAR